MLAIIDPLWLTTIMLIEINSHLVVKIMHDRSGDGGKMLAIIDPLWLTTIMLIYPEIDSHLVVQIMHDRSLKRLEIEDTARF